MGETCKMSNEQKSSHVEFAFLLYSVIIPNSQPWQLSDYNLLCKVCPLLKGHLSHKAICFDWINAGADQIVSYLVNKNQIDQPTQCFKESCRSGHVSIAVLLYPLLGHTSLKRWEVTGMVRHAHMVSNLPMFQWLHDTFKITNKELTSARIESKYLIDVCGDFFTDCIKKDENSSVRLEDIYKLFKDWWKDNYQGKTPSRRDMKDCIERQLGRYVPRVGWAGYKIVEDDDMGGHVYP